jgi:hypothetical protein
MNVAKLIVASVVLLGGGAICSSARVSRIEITRVESPTFQGMSFGGVGQYEKLVGRVHGESDPNDAIDSKITDVALAPRNAAGLVEYSADIYILRPIDRSKGNHRLFFEINNRGDKLSFGQLNDSSTGNDPMTLEDAGNGFLMRRGYTIIWSGWDVTVRPGNGRLTMTTPVAKNPDGSTITGPSLEEFVIDDGATFTGPLTYAAAASDKSQASLTVRTRYGDSPEKVPAEHWEYTDASLRAIKLLPDGTPFQRGMLYEFTYEAKDPQIAGLGLAAIRDLPVFLRHALTDDRGNPNPLTGDIHSVYSYCISQPCRAMHDFVWLGFNQDGDGRRVFDGMLNWVGGGSSIFLNYRFAQPQRTHRQHISRRYPEYQFPFAYQTLFDPNTGRTDGRLRTCLETNTCPKVLEVNSENEYWAKAGSVLHLDPFGNDLSDPSNVRFYFMSSLPHAAASGPGICQQNRNPLTPNPVMRALLIDLDDWASGRKQPPDSHLPHVNDGTLVPSLPQSGVGFPELAGVIYNGRIHTGDLFDFGPAFNQGILKTLPPTLLGSPYPALVPKTDADGNDIAGIRLPEIAVPLATYTGWGLRAFPPDANEGCDWAGQRLDFAATTTERLANGDPRLSIEERYPNHGVYVKAVAQSAFELRRQRLLLDEDVLTYIIAAAGSNVGK